MYIKTETGNYDLPWVDSLPSGWSVKRGKNVLRLLNRPVMDDDEVITCFRDGEVTLRKKRREEGFTVSLKEIGYQGIEPGDIVVHGMDGFAGAIGISDSRGKGTPVLNVMNTDENPWYIVYYLRALANKDVFMSLSTGIRIRSCDLSWNKLAVLPIVLPPRKVQDKIVEYLKEKVGILDEILIETRKVIEEYRGYNDAFIFETLTSGYKDEEKREFECPDWLPKIPVHFETMPMKRVVLNRAGGAWGDEPKGNSNDRICMRIADFDYYNCSFDFSDIEGLTVRNYTEAQIEKLTLQPGDILVEKSGGGEKTPVGRCILFDGDISPLYANFMERIQIDKTVVLPKYFVYWMHALYSKRVTFSYIKQTTGIQNLNLSGLLEKEYIAYPSLDEQTEIVGKIDHVTEKINSIIKEKCGELEKIEAMKKALINEIVLGQKEVG